MKEKLKLKKIAELRLNKIKNIYEKTSEICRMANVVKTYCDHCIASEEIYNISSVVKILTESLESLAFDLNQIIEDETIKTLPDFCKNIDLNNPTIEIVD